MIDLGVPDTLDHGLMQWEDAHRHIVAGDPAILAAIQRKKPKILQIQCGVITITGFVRPAVDQTNRGPDPVSRG